jgi:hypothetical protein
VRRHVAALKLGDMSPSSKVRTCPRAPKKAAAPGRHLSALHDRVEKPIGFFRNWCIP